jgi:hypothetical protein
MPYVADRVLETAITTGTGNFALAGAVTGYRTFSSAVALNTPVYYTIEDAGGAGWEVGIGQLSGATTLVRSQVLASSNAGALVSFGAGTKNVFITAPAGAVRNNTRGRSLAHPFTFS